MFLQLLKYVRLQGRAATLVVDVVQLHCKEFHICIGDTTSAGIRFISAASAFLFSSFDARTVGVKFLLPVHQRRGSRTPIAGAAPPPPRPRGHGGRVDVINIQEISASTYSLDLITFFIACNFAVWS